MSNSIVYDFETLSQDAFDGVVVNLALLKFDEDRFVDNPYTFQELVEDCFFIKFDVKEQVEVYGRKIQPSTIAWWDEQSTEARRMLKPSPEDVSISELYSYLTEEVQMQECNRVYTRGNTFDPIYLKSVLRHFDKEDPAKWWNIRDTRSLFEGMTYGHNIKSTFIPEGLEKNFISHNPLHDIAMDVMRFQYLVRLLNV